MAILVVGGGHRGVGKTALVCGLIAALPEYQWMAVKITSDDHGKPGPVWEETEAGQGTDTARYLAAGAARAFLMTASSDEMENRLAEFGRIVGPEQSVIYESNRVVDFIRPDLCLLVDDPVGEETVKPSFLRISVNADAMVVQASGDSVSEDSVSDHSVSSGSNATRPRFRLAAFERIPSQMVAWMRQHIPSAGHSSRGI